MKVEIGTVGFEDVARGVVTGVGVVTCVVTGAGVVGTGTGTLLELHSTHVTDEEGTTDGGTDELDAGGAGGTEEVVHTPQEWELDGGAGGGGTDVVTDDAGVDGVVHTAHEECDVGGAGGGVVVSFTGVVFGGGGGGAELEDHGPHSCEELLTLTGFVLVV